MRAVCVSRTPRDFQYRLVILVVGLTMVLALSAWLVWSESMVYRWLFRLFTDHAFAQAMLQRWGVLAPLVFIAIQILQVVIAPIPGDVTCLGSGSGSSTRRSASQSVRSLPSG